MSSIQNAKPTVLVIDDETSNIDIVYEILKDQYTVVGSPDPYMALEILKRQPAPNLILLDVNMPKMNGYDLCRRIKENEDTRDIPVIFITTNDQENDELFGFELGAADYITKPFQPAIAKARIKTHIALKQKSEELGKKIVELEKALRVFENKITRTTISKEPREDNAEHGGENEDFASIFLEDHVLDFAELEDIIDSRVSLMSMSGNVSIAYIHETAQAVSRYGEILTLYPLFITLGSGLKEFASNLKTIDITSCSPKNIKMALGCLETLSFTLLHWRQQLFSGTLTDPNAYDNSLLSDIKTIINLIDINKNENDFEEMELF
jgi:CheY-like chemotaxis protein